MLLSQPLITQSISHEIVFDQISTGQGLSQSNITSIAQDSSGYMWFGTDDGLNRFDGYEFKVFKYVPSQPNGLPTSAISALYVSKKGTLWIGTQGGGLCKYNPSKDGFEVFKNSDFENSISDNTITVIGEDMMNNIWIGTRKGGINRMQHPNSENPVINRIQMDTTQSNSSYISSFSNSPRGDLLFGTYNGIYILSAEDIEKKEIKLTQLSHLNKEQAENRDLKSNAIRSIYCDDDNQIWVGTWGGGISKLLFQNGQYSVDLGSMTALNSIINIDDYISSIHEDKYGRIWIGSFESGLVVYDKESQKDYRFTNDNVDENYISSNFVYSIASNLSGIMWVGTYGGGVNKFDDTINPFNLFQQSSEPKHKLSNNFVFAIHEDGENDLWIGTHGGGVNRLTLNSTGGYHLADIFRKGEIPSDVVLSIESDENEHIWIGTREGIAIYDPQRKNFDYIFDEVNKPEGLWGRYIWCITKDHLGQMWVGTRRGLNRWDPNTKSFDHYIHIPEDSTSLSHNNVYSIFEDNYKNIWIGTTDGLNVMKRSKGFLKLMNSIDVIDHFTGRTIHAITQDKSSRIWVATNHGLSCIIVDWNSGLTDGLKSDVRHFTKSDGLPADVFYGLLTDNQGSIWMSSNAGISNFDPEDLLQSQTPILAIRNYKKSDGLQSNEFNIGSYFKSESGYLFFGGNNGMNSFDPQNIVKNPFVPPISVTSIKVNDREVPLPADKKLELSWRDYAVTFEYSALSFRQSEKNQYSYQMKGFDKEPIYAGTRRFVNYTNLDPGSYKFFVQGSNNDDLWNEEGLVLNVIVSPPPWNTWWAYISYVSTFILFFIGYERNQSRKRRAKYETEKKIEKAKLEEREKVRKKSSQDFHDEIGNKLTKVSLLTGLIKTKIRDKETKRLVEKVEENNKLVTSGLRDFIWILDSEKDTLRDLIERIVQFGNSLFEHSNIDFESICHDSTDVQKVLDIDARKNIILLFKESMNNSLKYSAASKVVFKVKSDKDKTTFSLTDNGIGFELDREQDGYGLKNMMARADQLNAHLEIITKEGNGVVVVLTV